MKIHKLLYDPENTREQQITKRISEIVYYTKKSKRVYELASNVVLKLTNKDFCFIVKFRDEQQFIKNSEFVFYAPPNHWEDDQSFYLGKNVIIDENSLRPQGIKLLEELYEVVEGDN